MIRLTLRSLAGAALVILTFWNLHTVDVAVAGLQPRGEEGVTVIENQYLNIKYELFREYPTAKRIGYITALTLKGTPPDADADLRWSILRYVMIPRILVRGDGEPFVIGDFKPDEPVPPVPESLVKVYDSGNGMILYRQKQAP